MNHEQHVLEAYDWAFANHKGPCDCAICTSLFEDQVGDWYAHAHPEVVCICTAATRRRERRLPFGYGFIGEILRRDAAAGNTRRRELSVFHSGVGFSRSQYCQHAN